MGGNVVNQVTDQVVSKGKEAAEGFFTGLLKAPLRFISGAFGGLFSGALWFGGAFFLMQATGLARPIALAIGGQPLLDKIEQLGGGEGGKNFLGGNEIMQRLLVSAAVGAGAGALLDGTKGALGIDSKKGGLLTNAAIIAAVTVGAVLLNKHQVSVGEGDAGSAPANTPQAGAAPAPLAKA